MYFTRRLMVHISGENYYKFSRHFEDQNRRLVFQLLKNFCQQGVQANALIMVLNVIRDIKEIFS